MDARTIGILGGGQLGRMLVEAASRLNIKTVILDAENVPAKQISNSEHVTGSYNDPKAVQELASKSDILTIEIEHVDVKTLKALESTGTIVHPNSETIELIQDKFLQKKFLVEKNIPISPFRELKGDLIESLKSIGTEFGYPLMLKSRTLAYDGRGNRVVKSVSDIPSAIIDLGGDRSDGPKLYAEQWVKYTKELAVMVAKSINGEIATYPCVETIQENNVCHTVIAPAQIDGIIRDKARLFAETVTKAFSGTGIFGVEMFLLENGNLSFNEIAPRPHNSGHYTIEACNTSQFEQHIRCIMGYPLGSTKMKVPFSIMNNIIGLGDNEKEIEDTYRPILQSFKIPGSTIHLYGKDACKLGRKMGHITTVGATMNELISSASNLCGIYNRDLFPVISIIMGSDSDLPIVKPAAMLLKEFAIPFEVTIVSAHRTPDRMITCAKSARARGIKVIIAAAGGAAHLPGMVAALTTLPVIGIPVALKVLDGVDSLYSIVQMPRGVPVATVAINNAVNAALLAVRILSAFAEEYVTKLEKYMRKQEAEVMQKVEKFERSGWESYGSTE